MGCQSADVRESVAAEECGVSCNVPGHGDGHIVQDSHLVVQEDVKVVRDGADIRSHLEGGGNGRRVHMVTGDRMDGDSILVEMALLQTN